MAIPDASKSSFNADPVKILADGHSVSTLTLKLKDTDGQPLSGQKVTFHFDGPKDGIVLSEVHEALSGTYVATITGTVAEVTVLDAWVNDKYFNLSGVTVLLYVK